ncbi:uncharacterized protein LOC115949875 [Quercus lobata]|uniref:uncharacterized protein LOC115949875 n=1 Tax=Quercus lobata TaxID=97700 RepID=UPI001244F713|nr:uncharacterized protein LOC115949875 [Quercus lobata]
MSTVAFKSVKPLNYMISYSCHFSNLIMKPAELLKIECVLCDQIPVVRRFTGGGTVVVDPSTIFVTFICNKDAVAGLQPYPQPIMSWTGALYNKVFQGIGDFHLRENGNCTLHNTNYVFGDRKFGGNAQSITKNRWIHHTSFLWDYEVRNMAYLKLPARAPEYRLCYFEKAIYGNIVKQFA